MSRRGRPKAAVADPADELDDPMFDHEYLAAQSKENYERARAEMREARFAQIEMMKEPRHEP